MVPETAQFVLAIDSSVGHFIHQMPDERNAHATQGSRLKRQSGIGPCRRQRVEGRAVVLHAKFDGGPGAVQTADDLRNTRSGGAAMGRDIDEEFLECEFERRPLRGR